MPRIWSGGGAELTEKEADELYIRQDGTTPLTADWDAGAFDITMERLNLTEATNEIVFNSDNASGSRTTFNVNVPPDTGDVILTFPAITSTVGTLASNQTWTGNNIWTPSIAVTPVNDEFSQFGPDVTHLSPSDANDRFVSVKSSGAGGAKRAGLFVFEFTGSTNRSGQKGGLNAFGYTVEDSSGNITTTAGSGGLFGGRYAARHRGAGTVALGGGVASTASIQGADEDGTFTTAYAYLVESLDGGAGTGGITTGYGLLVRDTVGNVTNFSGIKIDTLSNATTNLEIETDSIQVFNGNLDLADDLRHLGDTDTLLSFTTDRITAQAGGLEFLDATEAATDVLDFGNANWSEINIGNGANEIRIDGGIFTPIREVSDNTTALVTDFTIIVRAGLSNITVTLPTAAAAHEATRGVGLILVIKRVDAGGATVTVDGNGAETIDGAATVTLAQHEAIMIQSDGTEWWII